MEQIPQPVDKPSDESGATGSYETYLEYNRILRTWFVAFGVGGPALFLVNDNIAKKLASGGQLKLVATLFLVGTAAQVIGALINKTANWYVHLGYFREEFETITFKLAHFVVDQFWIDILLDLISVGAFGYAAWQMLALFAT